MWIILSWVVINIWRDFKKIKKFFLIFFHKAKHWVKVYIWSTHYAFIDKSMMHIFKLNAKMGSYNWKTIKVGSLYIFTFFNLDFVATPRGEHMCNEREENGIFWGLMLKPSMVTTKNWNIILKCYLFIFYMSRPNLSTHTKKRIYIKFFCHCNHWDSRS
jgi:hypothetical protein